MVLVPETFLYVALAGPFHVFELLFLSLSFPSLPPGRKILTLLFMLVSTPVAASQRRFQQQKALLSRPGRRPLQARANTSPTGRLVGWHPTPGSRRTGSDASYTPNEPRYLAQINQALQASLSVAEADAQWQSDVISLSPWV